MAKKKSQTKARKAAIGAYQKQRRRIQRTVSKAQKRGYRFPEGTIPEKIKNLANLTTQRIKSLVRELSEITPIKLYQKATAISVESGDIISGTQRRREEQKLAGRKAAHTRQMLEIGRKQADQQYDVFYDDDDNFDYDAWREYRTKKDEEDKRRLKEDKDFREAFTEGEIALSQVEAMISQIGQDHKQAAWSLLMELQEEIRTYGREVVIRSIGEAPEEYIEAAQVAASYNPGDERHNSAIAAMWTIIHGGEVMSAEESAFLMDRSDEDASFSPLPDE